MKAFDCEEEMNYELSLWHDIEQSRTRLHNNWRRFCTAARAHLMSRTKDEEDEIVVQDPLAAENVMNDETNTVARAETLTLRSLWLQALAAESKEKEFITHKEKNEFIKVAKAAESEEKNEFIKVAKGAESEEKNEFIKVDNELSLWDDIAVALCPAGRDRSGIVLCPAPEDTIHVRT